MKDHIRRFEAQSVKQQWFPPVENESGDDIDIGETTGFDKDCRDFVAGLYRRQVPRKM